MCYDYALLSRFLITLWESDFSLDLKEAYDQVGSYTGRPLYDIGYIVFYRLYH